MTRQVLAAYRLSHDTDESTSIERQRERAGLWVQMQDDARLAAEAEDTDVSGNVSPFDRPDLGKYFRAPLVGTWNTLVVAKLDRLTRSVADFAELMKWCQDHGKTIVSIAESFDLLTAAGRMVAQIMVVFAEFERERISERCAESAAKLSKVGRWRGGQVPFGYVRTGIKGNYRLAQDAELAPIAARMADMAITGQSNGKIAAWLSAESVPCPKGGYEWTPEVVRVMLRNPSLAGRMVAKGQVVRDEDGTVVMATADPILTAERWEELQAAMDSRGQHHRERKGGHQLLRVLYCRNCSPQPAPGKRVPEHTHGKDERCKRQRCMVPMYGAIGQGRSKQDKYRCLSCGFSVPMREAEETVEGLINDAIGHRKVPRKVIVPAIDHTAELRQADASIADIQAMVVSGTMPARSAATMLTALEAKRDRLAALPQREEQVTFEPTGQSAAERWDEMTHDERGAWMREWGILCYADQQGATTITGWFEQEGPVCVVPAA
jgi:site-specific DNA recombinase